MSDSENDASRITLANIQSSLIVHLPHQQKVRWVQTIRAVRNYAPQIAPIASVGLPEASIETSKNWLNQAASASARIADPHGHLTSPATLQVKPMSTRTRKQHPWLVKLNPSEVLQAQRDAGADILLTAGRGIGAASTQQDTDAAIQDFIKSLPHLEPGEILGFNAAISSDVLESAITRRVFLNMMNEFEGAQLWHFKVQLPTSIGAFQQPLSVSLLRGYAELCELAADLGKVLLLPRSGLTGWLQLAFGAAGFGTGFFGTAHAFKEYTSGGGSGNPPLERYLEPQLLHVVEMTTHQLLTQTPGYSLCCCAYCGSMHAKPKSGNQFYDAQCHSVLACAKLAEVVKTSSDPRLKVKTLVKDAQKFAQKAVLVRPDFPSHLSVWGQVL